MENKEISLGEIFGLLWKNIWRVIFYALTAAIIAALITAFAMEKKYDSSTQILVNQGNAQQAVDTNTIATSVRLINTYREIILSDPIVEEALETIDRNDLDVATARGLIQIQSNTDSQIFSVRVVSENPRFSRDFANALATTFSNNIGDIIETDNVSIISEAKLNEEPVSPNLMRNIMIAVVIGSGLAVLTIFIQAALDNTVKDGEFFKELDVTFLGSIHRMTKNELEEGRFELLERRDIQAVREQVDSEAAYEKEEQTYSRYQRQSSKRV